MKWFIYLSFVCFVLLSGCTKNPCINGLELRPMYGKVEKCKDQKNADRVFIESSVTQYGSREAACEAMLRFGWRYYAEADLSTSIKRFNQAWLLDSANADVYRGFASILNDQGKFEESASMADKSVELSPDNSNSWKLAGFAYSNLFNETKDQKYLEESIDRLKRSASIDTSNAETYALLTSAYIHYNQKDSANKYMEITDRLNPDLIQEDAREQIGK